MFLLSGIEIEIETRRSEKITLAIDPSLTVAILDRPQAVQVINQRKPAASFVLKGKTKALLDSSSVFYHRQPSLRQRVS